MEQQIFKADAKQIVDMAFDAKLFKDSVTRTDMDGFEDLISYLLQSKFENYQKVEKFLAGIKTKPECQTTTK